MLIAAGTLSLVIGVIALLIPVVPTTPFLLVAAACYIRGSQRFYSWLINHRWLGPPVRAYREEKGMTLWNKVLTISTFWIANLVTVLFIVKVLFVRVYRQFYAHARTIGIVMGVMSFVLVGISAGHYLAVSGFGKDRSVDKSVFYELKGPFLRVVGTGTPSFAAIRTDHLSIERGRTLFRSRCASCHDPLTTNTIVGPGLKGLLRSPTLPVSKHPATAESLRFQLRQPLGRMPSFAYLSEDEMNDLIAYLNTL